MSAYVYRLLPSGNEGDFPWIDAELKRRNIAFEVSELRTGGRLYRIPVGETHKLPQELGEPYFGNEETGWSLHTVEGDVDTWERDREKVFGGSEWRIV